MGRFIIAGQFFFPDGGAPASRVRNLACGLAEAGADVHVIGAALDGADVAPGGIARLCPGVSFHAPIDARCSAGLYRFRNETMRERVAWLAQEAVRFRDVAQRLRAIDPRPDDVLVLYGRSHARLAPLYRHARARGMAVVWDVVEGAGRFGGFGGRLSPMYWDTIRGLRLVRRADVVTTITTGLAAAFRHAAATYVMPTLLAWPQSEPAFTHSPGEPEFRVLYVGGLLEKDDPNTLIAAMRIVATARHPIRLVVAGHVRRSAEGRARLAEIAADPVLARAVEVHDSPADPALERLRATSDAFVTLRANRPAEVLSFPTRAVECLSHAKPLVTTALGDLPLYLRAGEDALLVPPGDPRAVAAAFIRLASARDDARAIGLSGWAAGRRQFDRRTHARAVIAAVQAARDVR